MEFFILMSVVALFLSSILAAGLLAGIISALIMHYLPSTKAAKWLNSIWFDDEEAPDEIYNSIGNVKAGDCITKKA